MEKKTAKILDQGVALRQPDNVLGYSAWPSLCKDSEGNLVMVCSANRVMHVCPYGKVYLLKSRDEGKTWSAPTIAVDTPLDDRDAGILNLGGQHLAVTTFNNTREMQTTNADRGVYGSPERVAMVRPYLPLVSDAMEKKYLGSLMSLSDDDGFSWSAPFQVPVTAPHGPSLLKNGSMIYAGVPYFKEPGKEQFPVAVYISENHRDFVKLADIPKCPQVENCLHGEAHILELPSGRLLLQMRVDEWGVPYEKRIFSIVQTTSDDGGKTWTTPKLTDAKGAPPHLFLHSSGTLLCSYGRRTPDYGICMMMSRDEGETWDKDYFIWDQGFDADLGYPCTTELPGGDLFTVFYGKVKGDEMTSILWTRWRLPD